jgi:DNA-binding helix-hairpin-helix protein with protein kinase domain
MRKRQQQAQTSRQPIDVARVVPEMPSPPAPLRVTTSTNQQIECRHEPFSSGSEGRLHFTLDNHSVVKLYNKPEPWRQASLEAIIKKREAVMDGNPTYWERYFCWPEAMIVRPGLGMLMPRARNELRPFSHLLSPRFRKRIASDQGQAALGSWIGHVGILMKLARTVNRLHANGLCHSDLSTNNLLVDPVRGDATLIDCDGLVESGSTILLPTVLGTPDYMAPELVIGMTPRPGQIAPQPSVKTDLHSLAVLVYQGLLFRHPLRGSAFYSPDPDEDERLILGQRALYIEHPTDRSNRPRQTFLSAAILGPEMQNLLARAFIDGLHSPNKRPLAAEWERALVRMYDQTLPCSNPACEAKSFVLIEGGAVSCPWCHTPLKGPRQIPIFSFCRPDGLQSASFPLDFRLVGWNNRTLHRWHTELNRLPGPGVDASPVGQIVWGISSRGAEVWALNNLGVPQMFDATNPQAPVSVPIGKSVVLREKARIIFGTGDRTRVVEINMRRV